KPAPVEKLVRAAQDRLLADKKTHLFEIADQWSEAGRMTIELPSITGRKARTAVLCVRFGEVEIAKPKNRKRSAGARELPKTVTVRMVDAREIDPPPGEEPAHWRLLTTHRVNDIADARRIIGFYRLRGTIEQLFRTTKTKGFDMEALRQQEGGPLETLVVATLVAAVTVMQLVAERDGKLKRPLSDAFDPGDQPVLERVSENLEGKTRIPKAHSPSLPGLLSPRRVDRVLRQTRPHRHAQRPHKVPRNQAWLDPPRGVNLVARKGGGACAQMQLSSAHRTGLSCISRWRRLPV